jgi:hypothetical protein
VLGAGRRPLPPLPQAESHEREDKRAEPPSTGYWGHVWGRLRRDPFALCGGFYLVFVFLMCFVVAPILVHLLGHGPADAFSRGADLNRKPVGPWTHVPIVVYSTLTIAAVIVLEASISFIGLGIRLPTASWGNMLSTNWGTLLELGPGQAVFIEWTTSHWTTILPVVAIASTVLAFAAFGEGLRRALDPRSTA